MNYIKGILGGLLAILAAFGWCIALVVVISWWQRGDWAFGIYVGNNRMVWIIPFLLFSIGFYLAFRKAYFLNSK